MFLNFDFFLQLLYMAWVFGFKAWSTTRASVTPLDRVIEHSKSARVVTSFFVTTVPASPTEVETSIRTDVSAFTSQGMDWELTTPGRDRRWILGSLTYKDGNLNHLSCIGHCKGLLDFLGWCPPELTSTKLPVLNPKSSPCCKSMLAVPRFSNHRLPDFVSTTSMPGSRAVVVVASILDFNQFRTPNPTFSNNAWYMFWVELVGDKKTQKSCYILNSKPKGWLADSKSDTLTAASCKRLFQFNGRSPPDPHSGEEIVRSGTVWAWDVPEFDPSPKRFKDPANLVSSEILSDRADNCSLWEPSYFCFTMSGILQDYTSLEIKIFDLKRWKGPLNFLISFHHLGGQPIKALLCSNPKCFSSFSTTLKVSRSGMLSGKAWYSRDLGPASEQVSHHWAIARPQINSWQDSANLASSSW